MIQRILEIGFRVFMERQPILLEAERIAAFSGNNLLCDAAPVLAALYLLSR